MPEISVVMPTYNQKAFIAESVASVLSQSWSDFEFIIINDGSDDGTADFLKTVNDNRVRIIHQGNAGVHEALNEGFGLSKGRYMTCVSSDNLMLPGFLERCRFFLEAHPKIDFVYTSFQNIDEKGNVIDYVHSEMYYPGLFQVNPATVGISFLFKREVYDYCGRFRDYYCNDLDYWLRAARKFTFAYLPEVLSANRKHPDMQSFRKMKRMREQVEELIEDERCISGVKDTVCLQDALTRLRRTGEQFVRSLKLVCDDLSEPITIVGDPPLSNILTCLLKESGFSVENISTSKLSGERAKLYLPLTSEVEAYLSKNAYRLVSLRSSSGPIFGKDF